MKSLFAPIVVTAKVNCRPEQAHACYRALWRQLASYVDVHRDAIEIIADLPGELLAWRSRRGDGRVLFQPGTEPGTTDVTVELEAGLLARSRLRRHAREDLSWFVQRIANVDEVTESPIAAPPPRPFVYPRP